MGRQGDPDHALQILKTGYAQTRPENIAAVYACRKQLDEAFAWLDRADSLRDGALSSIRLDPCVKNLLAERALPAVVA
jgi:hypothetical protein